MANYQNDRVDASWLGTNQYRRINFNGNPNISLNPYADLSWNNADNQKVCNPCTNDPQYNAPPCPPRPMSCGTVECGPPRPRCGPNGCLPPCKDPCPLKSFCDPGLTNTCANQPIVNPCAPRRSVTTWKVNYLSSNRNNYAAHIDLDLVNPWGIVCYNNQLWVANGTSDTVTHYDLFGNKLVNTMLVRDAAHKSAFPTGIAVNCGEGSNNFTVSNGTITKSATFLICTEYGTIHAANPTVDPLNTYLVLNQQLTGEIAVYKGLAVANGIMYLADFFQGHIDVFNSSYDRVFNFNFIDGDTSDPIPLDYGPNNIVHIGCYLYVIWARRDPNIPVHDLNGPGHGYISVFNLDGSFVRRFTSRGVLNSPWAMIPAPCECGFPPGSFLVGNNGDGRINIFDCNGRYVGPLLNQAGLPICIEGLWGLAPHYAEFSQIFFTSTTDEDLTGILGSITKDQVINF